MKNTYPLSASLLLLLAAVALAALALTMLLLPAGPAAAQGAAGTEPANVQVAPGDGILTVSWTLTPREGVADKDILHALRWSQEAGVWANPRGPNAVGPNDGVSVAGGVTAYTITGLKNDVATGVFVRSFTGGDYNEGSAQSSKWVRIKGDNTTPRAGGAPPTATPTPAPVQQSPPADGQPEQQQQGANCPTPTDGDYDADDDGLIEVCNLAQLNAIRWDADGNGATGDDSYEAAFPGAAAGMGCPSGRCNGYELTADLDFDTNGNGEADAGDAYWNGGKGWKPIEKYGYSSIWRWLHQDWPLTVFEGNGHTIGNLFINRGDQYDVGLFSKTGIFHLRNVRLDSVDVTGWIIVGGLVGRSSGSEISACSVTGKVSGEYGVGGLVGMRGDTGMIRNSHSDGTVSGGERVGGLVGDNRGDILDSYSLADVIGNGTSDNMEIGGLVGASGPHSNADLGVRGSYAGGDVSGGSANAVGGLVGKNYGNIVASYSNGDVSSSGASIGGLVGLNRQEIRASYSSSKVSGNGAGGLVGHGWETSHTWPTDFVKVVSSYAGGAQLQAPTDYAGIYTDWNVDIDGIFGGRSSSGISYREGGNADDPWDFGTSSQYPALKRLSLSVAQQRGEPPPPVIQPEPTETEAQGTFSVSATASAAEGSDATLTITLSKAAPADGVAFTVTAGYSGDATATALDVGSIASPVTVAEGETSRAITIPTVDDDMDEDDETFTIVIAAATAGWTKSGDGKDTAIITITDDDTADVTISPIGLILNEGASATYTVVLGSMPTDLVHVTASSGDSGAVSVDPETYVISPSDWNVPRTFTVSGVSDTDATDESVTISHSVNGYRDAKYSGVTAPSLTVTVQDTTPRNFAVSPTASAAEGAEATLTVTLTATAPAGGVAFGVAANYGSGDGQAEQADVGAVPQTVTVAADRTTATLTIPLASDALEEGDETFTVTLTPPTGWTMASAGDAAATVTITDVAPPEEEAPAAELPGPVVNLQLTAKGEKVIASWEAPDTGGAPTRYIAHLKPADGGKGKTHRPEAGKTTTTFRNLEAGATYNVWVRAQNEAGKGERVHASITVPE